MPGSFSQATLLIELVAIVLVVVAIGVPQWSTSKVFRVFVVGNETNRGQEGSVEVGLWQACANLPGEIVFAGGEGLRDCRQGHCIRDTEFTRNTDQESNDLCHRSKESAGFVLLGLAAIISAAWVTAGQRFLGRKESHGLATFWAVVACKLLPFAPSGALGRKSIIGWALRNSLQPCCLPWFSRYAVVSCHLLCPRQS